jgi:hypothetical protein
MTVGSILNNLTHYLTLFPFCIDLRLQVFSYHDRGLYVDGPVWVLHFVLPCIRQRIGVFLAQWLVLSITLTSCDMTCSQVPIPCIINHG